MAPEDVTPDGLVTKMILAAGEGEVPPLHAKCLVHYTARLADGGDLVMDSRAEQRSGNDPVLIVAGRTSALRATGLNLGVATMKKGEQCKLNVAPEYGYGDQGSFSFPAVPPSAALEYEVELMHWEAATEERLRSDMLFEERLEAAERRRLEGNQHFRGGNATEAGMLYRMALSFLDEDLLMQLEGPHLEKANNVKLPLHLNLAACDLQLEDWTSAVENCDEVLREQPNNAKAVFRRGRARLAMGNTDAAEEDLRRAAALNPNDTAVHRQLMALKKERTEDRDAQNRLFRGRLPATLPSTGTQKPYLPVQRLTAPLQSAIGTLWAEAFATWQLLVRLLCSLGSWQNDAQSRHCQQAP